MELEFHQLDLRYEGLRVRRPERERRLIASLAEHGQQGPIVVVAVEGDRFVVIDGHKRVRALKRLREDTVKVTVWAMGEAEALILDRSLRSSTAETPLEQGWLLRELHEPLSKTQEQLAMQFGRSESFVSRRLSLVRTLPRSIQERVRRGEISGQVAMKYLVPMARVSREDSEALAQVLGKQKLTHREVGEVYAAWRDATPQLRQRLIEDPGLFLRAQREHTQPPEPDTSGHLMRELEMIGVLARRAARRWGKGTAQMTPAQRESAELCLAQARADLDRLHKQASRQEQTHAESQTTQRDPGASGKGVHQAQDREGTSDLAANSQGRDRLELVRGAGCVPRGEGRTLPAADPGPSRFVQGEQGPSP
jgi:ParB/RepB/Spo0J family partition protein